MKFTTVCSALVFPVVVACGSEPSSPGGDELVGEWQRIVQDCHDRLSTLTFLANREGKLIEPSCTADELICPSGDQNWFEWTVVDEEVFLEHYRRVVCGSPYPSRTIAGARYSVRGDTLSFGAVVWTRAR